MLNEMILFFSQEVAPSSFKKNESKSKVNRVIWRYYNFSTCILKTVWKRQYFEYNLVSVAGFM